MANAMKILIEDMFKEDVAYKEGNVIFCGAP